MLDEDTINCMVESVVQSLKHRLPEGSAMEVDVPKINSPPLIELLPSPKREQAGEPAIVAEPERKPKPEPAVGSGRRIQRKEKERI